MPRIAKAPQQLCLVFCVCVVGWDWSSMRNSGLLNRSTKRVAKKGSKTLNSNPGRSAAFFSPRFYELLLRRYFIQYLQYGQLTCSWVATCMPVFIFFRRGASCSNDCKCCNFKTSTGSIKLIHGLTGECVLCGHTERVWCPSFYHRKQYLLGVPSL